MKALFGNQIRNNLIENENSYYKRWSADSSEWFGYLTNLVDLEKCVVKDNGINMLKNNILKERSILVSKELLGKLFNPLYLQLLDVVKHMKEY